MSSRTLQPDNVRCADDSLAGSSEPIDHYVASPGPGARSEWLTPLANDMPLRLFPELLPLRRLDRREAFAGRSGSAADDGFKQGFSVNPESLGLLTVDAQVEPAAQLF